ncbi:MAG: hypothetical protein HFE62_03490 [Firmicutes bacterium]|nr:hypothetical protein [Bacillota bacterium]
MKNCYEKFERKGIVDFQELSLAACLEADKLYEKFLSFAPKYVDLISGIMKRLLLDGKLDKALIILRAMYILMDEKEPEYFNEMEKSIDIFERFLREFYLDWKECLEQTR